MRRPTPLLILAVPLILSACHPATPPPPAATADPDAARLADDLRARPQTVPDWAAADPRAAELVDLFRRSTTAPEFIRAVESLTPPPPTETRPALAGSNVVWHYAITLAHGRRMIVSYDATTGGLLTFIFGFEAPPPSS